MLIRDRLSQCALSDGERAVAEYILKQGTAIRTMTIKEIADASFSSPSTLLRIAHKMDFQGWIELKEAYLREEEYLNAHFSGIDANLPFQKKDSAMTIAAKIAALKKEAIDDTLSLITDRQLNAAAAMLEKASSIGIYASGENLVICRDFQLNMTKIGRKVTLCGLQGEIAYMAYQAEPSSCALIISYSGETPIPIQAARILKKHQVPIVLITSLGDNSLTRIADCTLRLCTREKLYSKIAPFSSDISTEYLLDVLYSCIFSADYDENLRWKIQSAREIEHSVRKSTVEGIREDL